MFRTILVVTIALLFVSCEKDKDQEPYRRAGITFQTGAGLSATNDTLRRGDTLRIQASVAQGSERLRMLYAQYRIGNAPWRMVDSVSFQSDPTTIRVDRILREGPQEEEWSILAREFNGDATRKSLRITVQ